MASEHTLYLVATPIGHLDDISQRAISTLRDVTTIYAEDTRHSLRLLRAHGIETPVQSLHEHNEAARAEGIAQHIRDHGSAALISDAGTPLISDPGYRLVNACVAAGVAVSPIPGACALIAALSASGLPTDRFAYAGFPPAKGAARARWFKEIAGSPQTLVFYESPHRILDALEQLVEQCGAGRELVMARELTKRFETILRASAGELQQLVQSDPDQQRGEFALVLGPAQDSATPQQVACSVDELIKSLGPHLPPKTIARVVADLVPMPRRDVYARVLALRADDS